MNWAAIAKVVEQFLRKFFRREHGKAVDTINQNRLVQSRNPKSGKWIVVDRAKGEIIGEGDEPLEDVEIVNKTDPIIHRKVQVKDE